MSTDFPTRGIQWEHNYRNDYLNLALQYKMAGVDVLNEIINSGHDNSKEDTWFLAGSFMLRQSIELILKAKACEVITENQLIQAEFRSNAHNLTEVLELVLREGGNEFSATELQWLKEYFVSVERIDEKSEFFRYPLNTGFLKIYSGTFLDIRKIANRMLLAFSIVYNSFKSAKKIEYNLSELQQTTEFFSFSDTGIGNFRIGWGFNPERFYNVIEGYSEVSEFLVSVEERRKQDYFLFPVMFSLRHLLELELTRFAEYDLSDILVKRIKSKSHRLYKDLWMRLRPAIEGSMGNSVLLDNVENVIVELDSIDRKGDFFRYPMGYNFEYHEFSNDVDVNHVLVCILSVVNFFEGIDGIFSTKFNKR
ncbi:hypothetical protein ACFFHY_04285 [Levilactobacillus acidifarinae]|uniref:hypothetical protein n=1 Tax=Levilactobacillus acidifarinae TaxID=267364 RepID=UPI0011BE9468|nr:hypothetical protein [Levilactobacillus acidifarinae]